MQNFYVYKIIETINNYYFYVISHVDDENIVLMQFEHTSANKPNLSMYRYLNDVVGWDHINIEKCGDVKAVDVINSTFVHDDKCMNISNAYESLIVEKKPKEKKAPKEKVVKEKVVKEKKLPKQKANKSSVHIDTINTKLDMNN